MVTLRASHIMSFARFVQTIPYLSVVIRDDCLSPTRKRHKVHGVICHCLNKVARWIGGHRCARESQIMSKNVFIASGHISNFADDITKCRKSNSSFWGDLGI